ncbi:hypothetical protein KUH03_15905 [Sphingobacterium sp. E70]|nr:hypothetical protein [Sphingobacterium sp. E70]ULT27958.1 hypothetical protein KUH03_15905 [Sphingobacterium sp. E70]
MMAALDKVHVRNTLYVFEQGGHGFGLINKTSEKNGLMHFYPGFPR